jgi:predicted nucleic acid-binding protein
MNNVFVFDACSLIALLSNEDGADVVKNLLQKATDGEINIVMHKVNFLEVYYYIYQRYSERAALKLLEDIKISPIKINTEITDDVLIKAGRLKSLYKMSLADSIGLAEALINNGYFVTADHHELEIVKEKEKINIIWIRERKKKSTTPP